MAHERVAKGIFIASHDFTAEAIQFARGNPIDLVSGQKLLDMIWHLPVDARDRLLAIATEGDYTTPTCPSCGVKMVWRNVQRGFWGCRNFPRCQQKFFRKTNSQ